MKHSVEENSKHESIKKRVGDKCSAAVLDLRSVDLPYYETNKREGNGFGAVLILIKARTEDWQAVRALRNAILNSTICRFRLLGLIICSSQEYTSVGVAQIAYSILFSLNSVPLPQTYPLIWRI